MQITAPQSFNRAIIMQIATFIKYSIGKLVKPLNLNMMTIGILIHLFFFKYTTINFKVAFFFR